MLLTQIERSSASQRSKSVDAHGYDVTSSDRAMTWCLGYARGSHHKMFCVNCVNIGRVTTLAWSDDDLICVVFNVRGGSDGDERLNKWSSSCLRFKCPSARRLSSVSWGGHPLHQASRLFCSLYWGTFRLKCSSALNWQRPFIVKNVFLDAELKVRKIKTPLLLFIWKGKQVSGY